MIPKFEIAEIAYLFLCAHLCLSTPCIFLEMYKLMRSTICNQVSNICKIKVNFCQLFQHVVYVVERFRRYFNFEWIQYDLWKLFYVIFCSQSITPFKIGGFTYPNIMTLDLIVYYVYLQMWSTISRTIILQNKL